MQTHALVALVISTAPLAFAAPRSHLLRRQNTQQPAQGSPGSIQKEIWIPLVVIAALFVVGTVFACSGRRLRRRTAQAAGVITGTAAPGSQEVSAEQLAGNTTANTTTNAGTGRARRPRRTRRTPSQISTHSLPAYMKEPGDQEIVIVRGADELEDDIPITLTMPPVDENGPESPNGSVDLSRPTYSPLPHSANNQPLLQSPENAMAVRASFDSAESSAEHSYVDEAPAYETVVLNDPTFATTAPTNLSDTPAREPSPSIQRAGTGSSRRRSMFASIFTTRNSRGASSPAPPHAASPEPRSSSGHTREGSMPSIISVSPSERDRRVSRLRHQPSQSGSGSMFSLLSRTRSNLHPEALTSPSMISLHSISAPLTHTVVKTEFAYPKGGPTPDQVRLIASRESIARFGRPYGADAIAHLASTSMVGLGPPPGFEEVAGSGEAGPSSSEEGRDSPNSGSQPHNHETGAGETAPEPHVLAGTAEIESPVDLDARHEVELGPSTVAPPSTSTSSNVPHADETPPSATPSSTAATNEAPTAMSNVQSVSPVGRPPLVTAPAVSSNSHPPPSAFKAGFSPAPTAGAVPSRATSRASSYMSYETAEESLHSPTAYESHFELDAYESAAEMTPVNLTAPPTPRMSPLPRHMQEDTDTTITPER